jgi:hypothetical protein
VHLAGGWRPGRGSPAAPPTGPAPARRRTPRGCAGRSGSPSNVTAPLAG